MTLDDIKIRFANAESLADVGPQLHHLIASYMTDPGASGGNWYGRGYGLSSLVVYRAAGWYVHIYRTKTMIVVSVGDRA